MPDAEPTPDTRRVLLDAGVFIGALLAGDPRHVEARPLVEQARQGSWSPVPRRAFSARYTGD
jgi:predicted nucleic acid-binding protein